MLSEVMGQQTEQGSAAIHLQFGSDSKLYPTNIIITTWSTLLHYNRHTMWNEICRTAV